MKTTPIRILLLNEHPRDRARVRDVLQQEAGEFELSEAGSAGEFDALIRSQPFDLVLSDIDIPGHSGQKVLEKVQAVAADLPVIILTNSESGQAAAESIQNGAADHIVRTPASLSILAHKIRQVLQKKHADELRKLNEEYHNDLITRIPVGAYISRILPDGTTKFEFVNPRFCEILGLNEADIFSDANQVNKNVHPEDLDGLTLARKNSKETRLPLSWEGRLIKDGELRWVRVESEPRDVPDGENLWNGVVMDITASKRLEEQLLQNENIFTSFLENSPVYVFFKDKDARALRLSSNFEQMLGLPVSQALGKNMDELFPSELAKSMVADDLSILNEGKRVDVVEELNGRTYETTKFPIFQDGKPEMLAGFTLDISERVLAEQALRRAEAINQAVISQSPIGVAIFNSLGVPLFGNQAWKKIWAFTEELYQQELHREFTQFVFEDCDAYLQDHQDQVRQVYAQGGTLYLPDLKIPHPLPGGAEWVSQYYYAILNAQGQVDRMVTLTEDISERKQAEAKVEKSRILLERAQVVAQFGSWEIDLAARTVVASAEAQRIYGLEGDVFTLEKVQASVLPEYRPELEKALDALIHQGQEYNLQFKIRRRSDGVIRDLQSRAEYFKAEKTVVGTIQDITERKLIMQVVMENEEKYLTLFEGTQDMILISDVYDRILDANKCACERLGYKREELLNMKVTDLQTHKVRGQTGELLKNDFNKYGSKVFENMALCKDGTRFPVEISLSKIIIANGVRFIVIMRAVSERKRIEQEIKSQVDTLESSTLGKPAAS